MTRAARPHQSRRQRATRAQARKPNSAAVLAEGVFDSLLDMNAIDSDDYLYRSLTRSGRGDNLPQYRHDKMVSVSIYLARTNPVARRMLNLLTEFVLGEGVSVTCRNDLVREVIDKHWADPYNDWDRHNAGLLRSFLLTGELLMPLFPNPVDGHLRVGVVKSTDIAAVFTDPENWRIVERVAIRGTTGLPRDAVSNAGPDADKSVAPVPSDPTASGVLTGKVYTTINFREDMDLASVENPALFWSFGNDFGERGISILYPTADFLDLLDQLAFSEVERWLLLKAFVWDVTVNGADAAGIAKFIADNPDLASAPAPGSVKVHNENVVYDAKSPSLDTADATNGLNWIRNHALGSFGIPQHWWVEGGDANRATAQTMAEPTRKMLSMLQKLWKAILNDVLQAAVDYAVARGTLPAEVPVQDSEGNVTDEMIPAREAVEVQMPDLAQADTQQLASSMQLVTQSLILAEQQGYITTGTARLVYLQMVQQLGLEFDLDAEAKRAEDEAQQKAADAAAQFHQQNPPGPITGKSGGFKQVATGPGPQGGQPGDPTSPDTPGTTGEAVLAVVQAAD